MQRRTAQYLYCSGLGFVHRPDSAADAAAAGDVSTLVLLCTALCAAMSSCTVSARGDHTSSDISALDKRSHAHLGHNSSPAGPQWTTSLAL